MVNFIVADPACKKANSAGIYPYKGLTFTRCHPSMADRVQQGLQGMSGNLVPIFSVKEWEKEAVKILTGK